MRNSIFIFLILLSGCQTESPDLTAKGQAESPVETLQDKVKSLAIANGFQVSDRLVESIVNASRAFQVDALQLTAIGILESGLGKNVKTRKNKNGTQDRGVFQINTVNLPKCKSFHIDTVEGNAFCAAKLLSQIKMRKPSDVAKYHSKTPSKKAIYFAKMTKVFKKSTDK